jgi:hypothetical protein
MFSVLLENYLKSETVDRETVKKDSGDMRTQIEWLRKRRKKGNTDTGKSDKGRKFK